MKHVCELCGSVWNPLESDDGEEDLCPACGCDVDADFYGGTFLDEDEE